MKMWKVQKRLIKNTLELEKGSEQDSRMESINMQNAKIQGELN